jgi:hypothetical protein
MLFQVPFDCGHFARPEGLSFLQAAETFPLSTLSGYEISTKYRLSASSQTGPMEKSLFFLTNQISPPFHEHYPARTGQDRSSWNGRTIVKAEHRRVHNRDNQTAQATINVAGLIRFGF